MNNDRISRLVKAGTISSAEAKRRREQQKAAKSLKTTASSRNPRLKISASVPNIVGMKFPNVVSSGDVVTVSFSEIAKVIHTSNGEIVRTVGFAFPGYLPYLNTSFTMFKRFRFRKVFVTYEPLTTSDTCGTIALSPCNSPDPGLYSMVDVLNNPESSGGPASVRSNISLNLKEFADDWFTCSYDKIPTNPPGAPKYMVWYQSPRLTMEAPTQSPVGVIRLSYTVQFTAGVMPPTGIRDPGSGDGTHTTVSTPSVAPISPPTPATYDYTHMVQAADDTGIDELVAAMTARGFVVTR